MAGLKFRVLLDSEDKSEVFRDILVADNCDFETFYRSIVDSYQFSQEQMASFYMSDEDWNKGPEITLFDMSFGEDTGSGPNVMKDSIIRDFIDSGDQRIILVHDFMRMWIFLIELIGYEDATPEAPKLVLSVGNAPSESSKSEDGENLQFETEHESGQEEDEDEYGFNEFEGGYDDYDF